MPTTSDPKPQVRRHGPRDSPRIRSTGKQKSFIIGTTVDGHDRKQFQKKIVDEEESKNAISAEYKVDSA